MNTRINTTHLFRVLLAPVLLACSAAAGAVSVAQVPLFISTGTAPNLLLLVDNSGSMFNIIWADDYDPVENYPDWSPLIDHDCNPGTAVRKAWDATDGNLARSYLVSSHVRGTCGGSTPTPPTCTSGYTRGRNAANVTKCLMLPDPAGSNLTRYTANYLNYLFETYPNGTDLRNGQIPVSYRMQVARSVATNIVNANTNLRLGLASFNPPGTDPGPGGGINAACGTSTETLTSAIAGLTPSTNTPLAETMYEITRYFRGLSSQYNPGVSYTSPVQYRCQKNFVVVVTDGFPTRDTAIPSNDPADLADTARSLPNWDGLAPVTAQSQYPVFPPFSDGFQPSGTDAQEGHTLYLDDLAKFGFDIDLRSSETDASGVSFDDPEFPRQNLSTYAVGFAISNQMLADSAVHGDGRYYSANNEAELNTALRGAFADIVARTSSAASVATNSTRLTSDSFIYQARFSSSDWSGQLLALPIEEDGTVGPTAWNAADLIAEPAARSIFTYDPTAVAGSRGRPFLWASLNATQKAALNTDADSVVDNQGQARLEYLRGDDTNESPSGLQWRSRSSMLGDIANADPLFVGHPNFGFHDLPGSEGTAYKAFRQSIAYLNRPEMLYVAANDGMLHAFNAATGDEVFAYVPDAVYPNLSVLTDPGFNQEHRFILDGSPKALDAVVDGAWRTVLLGTLGAGGKGVFALDVTSPGSFSQSNVMWEFGAGNDPDLGVSIPQATIARLYDGSWGAIIANGYNSSSGHAVLFIVDLETGSVLKKIDTGAGGDNGLSSPIPVDVDGDRITDFIYAGDLHGQMWKFDVTSSNPNQWEVAFGSSADPQPLFTACADSVCSSTNRQPITSRPEVGINPAGGQIVYFGTGRYFAIGDNTAAGGVNSFYAIRDVNTKSEPAPVPTSGGRDALLSQEVLSEQTLTFSGVQQPVRVTSNYQISDSHEGWYIDLPGSGERQVSNPILRAGRILFTTLIPVTDPCGSGGTSWLMEMDALSGSRLPYSPFDLNHDYEFNVADFAIVTVDSEPVAVPVSGRMSLEGIIKTPGVISGDQIEFKYASGTSGGIDTTIENTGRQRGRQSWRQIR